MMTPPLIRTFKVETPISDAISNGEVPSHSEMLNFVPRAAY